MKSNHTSPRIGIALGGGAARGWAHIGALRALEELGIRPDVVAGTSIGAMVGGIYLAGHLEVFEDWVVRLTRREVWTLLDLRISGGGALGGRRLMDLYREHLGDVQIEDLPRQYAAVATDLHTGAEVWLQEGPLLTAIRASISIPGIFTPIRVHGRWLVDGGLVNPVPVSLCRALGADLVIAVDLNQGLVKRGNRLPDAEARSAVVRHHGEKGEPLEEAAAAATRRAEKLDAPSFNWVVNTSIFIMQDRITRSRLAGDPPDLLLTPRVSSVPWMEFTGGRATIQEGYDVVRRSQDALESLLGRSLSR